MVCEKQVKPWKGTGVEKRRFGDTHIHTALLFLPARENTCEL